MLRRLALGLMALVWMLPAIPVAGQETPIPESTVPPSAVDVPPELASPRATMATFLGAFYAEAGADLETAASCLDLGDLPASVRSVKGRELVIQLKQVLDRTRLVDLEKVPVDPERDTWTFADYPAGSVEIQRVRDGRWLFNRETVRDIDAIYVAIAGREVVEGVERTADATTPAMWLRGMAPKSLQRRIFLLEGWQWLGLFAVIVIGVVIGRIFGAVATGALDRLLKRHFSRVDRHLVGRSMQPSAAFVMVVAWGLGAVWLGLPPVVLRVYLDAIVVVAVIAFTVMSYRFVEVVADILGRRAAATESGFDDLLVPLLRTSLKVFIIAVGLVMIAQNLGTDVTGLIAGLGLGGLAFALAAKDTVGNLFGSITVLLDRPFQVGDWVKVGDVEGTVEEMGFRSTRIRTFYNSLITLPNSNLIAAAVDNLGARTFRRWSTRLGIAYDTPPELVDAFCEGVRELVRSHPYTRKDYFHVYLNEFGAASLEVLLYVFFRAPDWSTELRERHRLGVDILRLAHELGIEFAFPTQTLYLRQESWSPRDPAGAGYGDATGKLADRARDTARNLVADGLGGAGMVPPPVTFDTPPTVDGGDVGE
jgi:MscS family membrane protein